MNDPAFTGYLVNGLLLLLNLALVYRKLSGKPEQRMLTPNPLNVAEHKPLHEKFAPLVHEHSQYIHRGECPARHDKDEERNSKQMSEIKTMIHDIGGELKEHNAKAEARASLIHTRINAISDPLSSLTGRFNDHLHAKSPHKGAV